MIDYGPPERLKGNQFWGKRSGSYSTKHGSNIFQGKRWAASGGGNSGPSGKKLRWYPERALSKKLGKGGLSKLKTIKNAGGKAKKK